ncbi:hypothetical protein [Flavobacterium sp. N2270]|uniref:hypothetical protein n=1 Tax=Flavobacterium sp. N2270 TaxID=2986831 RepID=UPI0022257CE9|nr:hypothetical protein [Flavobacterium sp. N2270]
MKKLIGSIIIIVILTSCSSVKNSISKNNVKKVSEENFELLNGTYKNSSAEPNMKFTSLWSVLNYNAKEYDNWKDLNVKISINKIDQKSIILSLLENEKIIEEINIKGEIQDNYYLFKNQKKAKMMVFILIWGIGNSSVKIGISEKNELIVLSKTEGIGLIVAFPAFASGGGLREYKFDRIE